MNSLLFVAIGGAIGSTLRYLTTKYTTIFFATTFPLGTFLVNILGSFFIGIASSYVLNMTTPDSNFRLLIIVGFLGGYTTFSSFSLDTIQLLSDGNYLLAAINVFFSVILGIVFAFLGLKLGHYFFC